MRWLDADQLVLDAAGDIGAAGAGDHVDLVADAEGFRMAVGAGEVEAGFDGEAGVGENEAGVVGLEVVEMGAIAVELGRNIVAGPVGEEVGEACRADDGAGGVVGLPAGDGGVGGEGLLDDGDGGVAGIADSVEDEVLAVGGFAVDDAGPGDVVPDGLGVVGELGPDVDEDEVAAADGFGGGAGGLVVGVGGVGADGDVGAVLGDHASLCDSALEEFDDGEFVSAAVGADAGADLAPAFGEDVVEAALGFVVGGDLGFGEDGFEVADQVGGRDDVFFEGAEEFYCARVDERDVHDGVARGVLHGDLCRAGEHGLEFGFELLPGGVFGFGAGEEVEFVGLDAVDEFLRLALGGDEVVPAAGDVAAGDSQDAVGEVVAVVVVVEEPAVEIIFAEGGLDGGEVHGGGASGLGDGVLHGALPLLVKSAQSIQSRRHEFVLDGQVFWG
jgi:hypothetical protein